MVVPLRADCRLIKRGTALSALWKTKVRNAVYFYFFTFRYYENSLFNVFAALHFIFFPVSRSLSNIRRNYMAYALSRVMLYLSINNIEC